MRFSYSLIIRLQTIIYYSFNSNKFLLLLDDMSNHSIIRELKLHSPAGVEPAVFTWPNVERQVNTH
jgi:hypothetical protein